MESSEQQSCESLENSGAIVESFLEEESPTLPATEPKAGATSPCNPNVKITIFAEIPTQHVKKGIRLLPTQTLASFVAKLQKKKIISSGDGGAGGEISILHIATTDLVDVEKPLSAKKKESLLNRFRSAAAKTLRTSANSVPAPKDEEPLGILFGIQLEIVADMGAPLMSAPGIPTFLSSAFEFLKTFESKEEGLFRLSGSAATIKTYKKIIDRGEQIEWQAGRDAHNAAGLIKMYLRELPEPLLTFSLFSHFCSAVQCTDREMTGTLFRSLLSVIPMVHYNLLKFIITELVEISKFEEHTKMGVMNLATLFGPNLGRPAESIFDQAEMLQCASRASAITCFMLRNAQLIFDQVLDDTFKSFAVATFDYSPTEEDELSLHVGEAIFVTDCEDDEGWWTGQAIAETGNVKYGKFPSNYVTVLRQNDTMISMSSCNLGMSNSSEALVIHTPELKTEASVGLVYDDSAVCLGSDDPAVCLDSDDPVVLLPDNAVDLVPGGPVAPDDPVFSNDPIVQNDPVIFGNLEPPIYDDNTPLSTPHDRLLSLEMELASLKVQLAEESKKRQELAAIIPELVKNQDQVLKLLQTLNGNQ